MKDYRLIKSGVRNKPVQGQSYGGTNDNFDYTLGLFDIINEGLDQGSIKSTIIERYAAANDVYVVGGGDIIAVKQTGSCSILVPEKSELLKFTINGGASDLIAGEYLVVINTMIYNTNVQTFQPPLLQVLNTTAQAVGGASTSFPFIYNQSPSPQMQIVAIGSGDITLKITGLDAFLYWTIIGCY